MKSYSAERCFESSWFLNCTFFEKDELVLCDSTDLLSEDYCLMLSSAIWRLFGKPLCTSFIGGDLLELLEMIDLASARII